MLTTGIAIGLTTLFYRMANLRGENGFKWGALFILAWAVSTAIFSFSVGFFQWGLTENKISASIWRIGVGLMAGAVVYLIFELKMKKKDSDKLNS